MSRALVDRAGAVREDAWRTLGEDAPAAAGDVVVSLPRFLREREALLARDGRLGVRIAPGEAIEDIADDISRLALIAVAFPAFRDGRGYSTARLARERYNFKGELRAVGDVREDQIFYMLRCGFDSFDLIAADPAAAFARAAHTFSVFYQRTDEARTPARALRQGAGE